VALEPYGRQNEHNCAHSDQLTGGSANRLQGVRVHRTRILERVDVRIRDGLPVTLIRRAQLPEPQVNVRLHGYEVDFHWRAQRVVVEIDGFRFHST